MSTSSNNLAWRSPGNLRAGGGHSAYSQNSDSNQMNSSVSQTPTFRPADAGSRTADPWQLFEERVRTGPYGLTGFPAQPPLSPIRILFLDGGTVPRVNPLLRHFVRESPPRIRGQWHVPPEEEPGLTQEQQRQALKQLKKHVYNPSKFKSRRWNLYYRDNIPTNSSYSKEEGRDEDNKGCPICLEDFVANQDLLITPCKHMFHDECILPWVKSHGQCPVCRFALCDMDRRAPLTNNPGGLPVNDLMPEGLISLVRAMEEAMEW